MARNDLQLPDEPLWFKDAVIYELHIKSFCDSDDDGVGDLKGLLQKLDYLQRLGVTALWLLPFYPSPLRDDGYDIADYYAVHPQYGTLSDFKLVLREAHRRGLRVITELVLNHTSDQHRWFQKSRAAKPGSIWRNFYVWSDTPDKYRDARIIFRDFETSNWTWDPVAKAYFWHRFYSHQPDLNFENPHVVRAMLRVVDYWFDMGVDGMRLDAVPYLYEREGTNCENLPETYDFLQTLRAHVDQRFKDRMLLAEANQWPEDAVAYFGRGNRCHMAFHFPLMPRLFMGARMEDRFPIVDIFEQTPAIPANCQWALFLRNHDELTLEMVSDEERDYMYQVYAKDPQARINLGIRRRLAPLLGNNRRKIELMNILLFSLPGTPVLYYGDEIGMGDNHYLGDRNGVRTPMQWNADRNSGFSRANPQKLYLPVIIDPEYLFEAVNVENQERNQSSLLWWMRRVLALRRRFKAFGRGSIEFLPSDNPRVLAFIRSYEEEIILVVVNLSRFSQAVELELASYDGYVPIEVMSGNKFPAIKSTPYVLTLGFYDYYWFALKKAVTPAGLQPRRDIPVLAVNGDWHAALQGKAKERLVQEILPAYFAGCHWFSSQARSLQQVCLLDSIPLESSGAMHVAILELHYEEGASELYLLPLSFLRGLALEKIQESPQAIIAHLQTDLPGALCDATYDESFRRHLLTAVAKRLRARGQHGELSAHAGLLLKNRKEKEAGVEKSQLVKVEQNCSSIIYGSEYFLKLYRRLQEGPHPDLEIGRFLSEQAAFTHTPAFLGALEYRRNGAEPILIGVLQKFVPHAGEAWSYTLGSTGRYLERVLAKQVEVPEAPSVPAALLQIAQQEPPPLVQELIGGVYLETARLIGKRTAELHLALAGSAHPAFAPEPFTQLYQRALYHAMRTAARRALERLRRNLRELNEGVRSEAEKVLKSEKEIVNRFSRIFSRRISAMKIRIHGNYQLGRLLFTGNDFIITDFAGDPGQALSERRLKRSPLRDVAGMIRSFHYPAYVTLFRDKTISPRDVQSLKPWADLWYQYVSGTFLQSYLETAGGAAFLPARPEELELLLHAYLLGKALQEMSDELARRPDWVIIPLHGILHLLASETRTD